MKIVLLALDAQDPLEEDDMQTICKYLECFFCCTVDRVKVPKSLSKELSLPEGVETLTECMTPSLKLKIKPGRQNSVADRQICLPQLMACLRRLTQYHSSKHGVPVDGARCILGITKAELFTDDGGVLLNKPLPPERIFKNGTSSPKDRVGVCSVAQQDLRAKDGVAYRKLVRSLLHIISHAVIQLLGLKTCQFRKCLAFLKPFDPAVTPFWPCADCEGKFMQTGFVAEGLGIEATPSPDEETAGWGLCTWSKEFRVQEAANRYSNMQNLFRYLNARLGPIRIGHRYYEEFEEECDWLSVAEDSLLATAGERKRPLAGTRMRQRSLAKTIKQVHERQPPKEVLQRGWSEPLLKKTCQVDMTMSAPFRHDSGDLGKWCTAVINRKHTTGGHYVELGGALRGKTISSFVDSGLNASFIKKRQELPSLPHCRSRCLAATTSTFKTCRMNNEGDPSVAAAQFRSTLSATLQWQQTQSSMRLTTTEMPLLPAL